MILKRTLAAVYIHLMVLALVNTESVFEQSPSSTTAGLGLPAVFQCITTTQPGILATAWFVDGASVLDSAIADRNISAISQQLPDGGAEGILSIPATEPNNNTEIVCQIITTTDRFNSTSAVLTIQGLLAAPGNPIVVDSNDRIPVLLRWDAPFSLDITNVEPDISNYRVFITNLNTSRNGSETVAGTGFEFTNLPEEDPNPCYIYVFTIAAVNIVGEGNVSEPVLGNIRGVPQAVSADRVDVTLVIDVQSGTWTISMECELAPLDCPGAVPETFMVNATNADGSAGCVHSDMIAEPTSQGRLRISFTANINVLIVNDIYNARIHAVNSVGNTPSDGFVKFTTFDLQTLTVHLNGTVTCQYVTGSAAQGCLVIAREGDDVVYAIFRIQESTDSLRLEESGDSPSYTVMGFDLEQDGVFSTRPAVIVRNASVTGTLVQELDNTAVSMATATTEDDGLVCVTCTLTVGSDATGCAAILIPLEDTGSEQILFQSFSQDQSGSLAQGCFPVFLPGNFSLAIFAVGSSGPLGTAPAHVAAITISEAATTPPPGDSDANTTAAIAGTIAAVAVLITVSIVVLCLCYRYRKRKREKEVDALETVYIHETTRQPSDDTYSRVGRNQQIMTDSDDTTRDQQQSQFAPNSQYSLLQPADAVEAPPAYETVVEGAQTQDNRADYELVREKKPHYAELDAFPAPHGPPPTSPSSQEVPVQYSQIVPHSEGQSTNMTTTTNASLPKIGSSFV